MNITQKEEFRYQYAGMAMQAIIQIASRMDFTEEIALSEIPNDLIQSLRFQMEEMSWERAVALEASLVADALIAELEKGKKGFELVFLNPKLQRPEHLERCLCWDSFEKGYRCYVYDDISKYWCTQATTEHDPNGDNHVSDYADNRITHWSHLPKK